jgi:hypothetical protein
VKRAGSNAARILSAGIAAGRFDVTQIAAELITDERSIGLYIAGLAPMPIDRQICFARFLVEHVPALARQGHNLLSQLRSQVAFETGVTKVHDQGPPGFRSR